MLKELFDAICDKERKAFKATVIQPAPEPSYRYLIQDANGSYNWFEALPQPRQHKAADLSAILAIAKEQEATSVVWYSREAVTLFYDDETRRDQVRLALLSHPQLNTMLRLEKDKPKLDQKEFLRLLRIDLAGCDPIQGATLVDIIRKIRFKKNEQGENVILHNKASLGRSIENELIGGGPIPEKITLSVPIFKAPRHLKRYPIGCAIEIDPAEEKFQLVPFPGEIDEAVCLAERDIAQELREALPALVPIYYGAP